MPYQADHEDSIGQFEINWTYDDALITADRHVFYKWMVREAAARRGMVATFMPKPFTHLSGNSAHMHLSLYDAAGVPAARAEEEFKCCWPCTRQFSAETYDAPGAPANTTFHMRVGELYSSRGNNCFAPSCCNRDYDMDVLDASESVVVGHVANVWPGCNCGGLTERSNLVLRFPPNATPKQRAALVASTFLVEFAHFELRRQNN